MKKKELELLYFFAFKGEIFSFFMILFITWVIKIQDLFAAKLHQKSKKYDDVVFQSLGLGFVKNKTISANNVV